MKKSFLPALLAMLMLATVAPTFTACSDDDDDKLVIVPEDKEYSDSAIDALTEFQERFFESEIIR